MKTNLLLNVVIAFIAFTFNSNSQNLNTNLGKWDTGNVNSEQYLANDKIKDRPKIAVNLPFEENFENKIVPPNWINYTKVGKKKWEVVHSHMHKTYSAVMFTDLKKIENNQNWLITPKLKLSGKLGKPGRLRPVYITFDVLSVFYKGASLSVYISYNFNGTNFKTATWTNVTNNFKIPKNPGSKARFVNAGNLKLLAYNKYMHIAFVYRGINSRVKNTGAYAIDNIKVSKKNPTSISNLPENKLVIYPNPAENYVLLNKKAQSVEIINLTGKTVLFKNNVNDNEKIDISDLHSGIYILKVNNGDDTMITKFNKK